MDITFRFARSDEYLAISRFLNDYWAQDHVYCRDKALFDWTFRRPVASDSAGLCFAIAEAGDELAGILGGIPFRFNDRGRTLRGVWTANYIVRPDFRKGVTALRLLALLRRPPFDIVIASGIRPAIGSIFRALRGEVLPAIPRYVSVPRWGYAGTLELLRIAQPGWDEARRVALVDALLLTDPPPAASDTESLVPPDWDARHWPSIAARTVGAAREMTYLQWRYLDHPRFEYRIISNTEGERAGLLIWRLETIQKAEPDGSRSNLGKMARIVEFLPFSEDNARDLVGALYEQMRREDAMAADYYGFHGETSRWLCSAGFAAASDLPDGPNLPARFQPLDGKSGDILSAMFRPQQVTPCAVGPDCPWYWTKSDADQDRPN